MKKVSFVLLYAQELNPDLDETSFIRPGIALKKSKDIWEFRDIKDTYILLIIQKKLSSQQF